jgi:capsular exopolysaccharide synthesis family protein
MSEWQRAVEILQKRWRWSALFALVVTVLVTAYTIRLKAVYEPEARLEVDPPGSEVFSLQGGGQSGAASGYLETQAQNLQSDGLALDVIRSLHLDQNPEFAGKAALTTQAKQRSDEDGSIQLTPAEDKALNVLRGSRQVTHDSSSRLISVSVASHDPVLAANITNTLVSRFIERNFKMRNDAILQSSEWLQKQLEDIRQRMEESNHALAKFQNEQGIGAIGDNQNTFSERMIELSRQLMQAQADRIQLQAYLDKLNGVQASSLPQISGNPVVQGLTTKLAETRAELAQTRAVYGENHPNSKKLQNQADELQSQLTAQRTAILSDLRTSYSAARAREQLMESQVQSASKQMSMLAQYNALKKEADANTQLYGVLYQRIKEAAIAAETKSSNVRIVDKAHVLTKPTRPNRKKNVFLGLLAGLMGGVLLAFVIEGLDSRIRTPEDVKHWLEGRSVSVMPVIGADERYALFQPGFGLLQGRPRIVPQTFFLDRPNSPEAEALRGIYTAVRLSRRNEVAARVLLIASPLSGEGKTVLSVNLALALAQHAPTCIVDADLRKEGVAPTLGIVAEHGLGDVLLGRKELDEALCANVRPGLSVLAAGSASEECGTLIASSAMSDLIERLRQRFEFVVIDSPPILPFADARSLSVLVDGIVLVGRSGVTTRANLGRALELIRSVRSAPVIEFVLNAAQYPTINYGYYRYRYGKAG